MFDISTQAVSETGTVDLKDVKGAPLFGEGGKRCSITMHGPGSKVWRAAQAKVQSHTIERIKKKGNSDISADEQADVDANFLSAVTVSFNNFTYPAKDAKGDRDIFKAAYADAAIGFIAEQANEFCRDWENFTGGSAKS